MRHRDLGRAPSLALALGTIAALAGGAVSAGQPDSRRPAALLEALPVRLFLFEIEPAVAYNLRYTYGTTIEETRPAPSYAAWPAPEPRGCTR